MTTYSVIATPISTPATGHIMKIGFGAPAQNTDIVKEAKASVEIIEKGGELVLFNGPASLPVSMTLAHAVAHLYGVVACFDPKLNGYVVAISHDPRWAVGDLIPATEVKEA